MPDDRAPAIHSVSLPGIVSRADCAALRAEMTRGEAAGATVQGVQSTRSVYGDMRRATLCDVSAASAVTVALAIDAQREALRDLFDRALVELEPLQFLRYGPGDFFVAHQDGNTPLIRDDTRFRKVSVVLFLSEPSDYDAGDLILYSADRRERLIVRPAAGTLVAFPSEMTHEVTPIAAGERFTVASWFRGPAE
jgi:SM-20-related protein